MTWFEFPCAYAAKSQNSPPEFRATHSEDCKLAALEALMTTNDSQSLSLPYLFYRRRSHSVRLQGNMYLLGDTKKLKSAVKNTPQNINDPN